MGAFNRNSGLEFMVWVLYVYKSSFVDGIVSLGGILSDTLRVSNSMLTVKRCRDP